MQHKCKVTVIRKELYPDLQETYLADPASGPCPFYSVGDEFVFERYGGVDTFWTMGRGSQCSEAWDCISRYIYTALQGGAIMRGWTADERVMIACCNDGTRPVVFKIERVDYKVAVLPAGEKPSEEALAAFGETLLALPEVAGVQWRPEHGWVEVVLDADLPDGALLAAAREACLAVDRVD